MTCKANCCYGSCARELQGEPGLDGICRCGNGKRRTGTACGSSDHSVDELW